MGKKKRETQSTLASRSAHFLDYHNTMEPPPCLNELLAACTVLSTPTPPPQSPSTPPPSPMFVGAHSCRISVDPLGLGHHHRLALRSL